MSCFIRFFITRLKSCFTITKFSSQFSANKLWNRTTCPQTNYLSSGQKDTSRYLNMMITYYLILNIQASLHTSPNGSLSTPLLLAGMQVQAHLLTPLTAADSNLKYNIPCILASWRHFRSCQPARVKLYTVHNWSGWRVTFVLVIIKPAQSVGFWRIKKKPYQAPPTQLGPQKCTFRKNAFLGPKYQC